MQVQHLHVNQTKRNKVKSIELHVRIELTIQLISVSLLNNISPFVGYLITKLSL